MDVDEINIDSKFVDDFGADSLDIIDLSFYFGKNWV
ncbi:MAG: acyl carrier protein [Pseudohongiellaceae bacterium]|jgi:acyl carrier protein